MYYIVGTNVRMATNHKTMEYLYIAEKKGQSRILYPTSVSLKIEEK